MSDNWQKIGAAAKRATAHLEPTYFEVPLSPDVTSALDTYSRRVGQRPETIIAEATRAYLGAEA